MPNVAASGHPYADFLFGVPTSASRAFPPVLVERSRWMYEYFFQDDWKLSQRLTLNLGVRYEYHPVWEEDNGMQAMFDVVSGKIAVDDRGISLLSPLIPPGYVDIVKASDLGLPSRTLVRSDKNNIAPRFGLAYKPFSGNDTVVRAGYGIYYDTTPINPTQGGSPFVINEPGFTNTTPAPTLVLPQAFPATGTGGPSTIGLPAAINPDLKMPYSQQWNLTIEHQQWATGFRVSYIGTNTRQMQYDYNINAPVVDERLFIDKPRRFPRYPGISYFDHGANHNYHGFSIEAERKLSGGLYFQSGYTWARDIGDQTGGSIENPYDRGRERSVDQTHSYPPVHQRDDLSAALGSGPSLARQRASTGRSCARRLGDFDGRLPSNRHVSHAAGLGRRPNRNGVYHGREPSLDQYSARPATRSQRRRPEHQSLVRSYRLWGAADRTFRQLGARSGHRSRN